MRILRIWSEKTKMAPSSKIEYTDPSEVPPPNSDEYPGWIPDSEVLGVATHKIECIFHHYNYDAVNMWCAEFSDKTNADSVFGQVISNAGRLKLTDWMYILSRKVDEEWVEVGMFRV